MQVAFKGYPGTLGATFVQHLITDRLSSPPEYAALGYQEQLVYMPHTYYPVGNRATWRREQASSASPTPGSRDHVVGVPADIQSQGHAAVQDPANSHARTGAGRGLVYGAFNDHYKIDPAVFRVWMDILKEDAGSVLWFLKHGAEKSLRKSAAAHKVDPDRLVFSDFFPKTRHLQIKGTSDVFLDTPLYNAHSTASDMLWAQVCLRTGCVCVCWGGGG